MSRPPVRRTRPEEDNRRTPNCNEGPSLGTVIAGIAGIAGAVGLGYLLGATSREEAEETERQQSQRLSVAERRRQQQLQQQQLANHSYYPAHYGSRQQQQHTEIKEATDHSNTNTITSKAISPAHPSQPNSASLSASSPHPAAGVASRPLQASASAPVSGETEDESLCKICYDAPMDAVLFPCRHQCCCYACSEQLHECPVCRTPFTSAVKIYRS